MKITAGFLMLTVLLVSACCAASGAQEAALTAVITLHGTSASVQGEGVTVIGSAVTITAGGSYMLSGELSDGQIIIDAGKKDTVELILNGVSINSSESAAIYAKQAETTIVTLPEGARNVLSDAANYLYADASADEPAAALFAKDDLTIRGTGALSIYGNYQNGITSKDHLVIEGGTITVAAENHGMRGKDSVRVLGGTTAIQAGGDGIQTDQTVRIEGGVLDIVSAHDGIQAETGLIVSGGEIHILAGGGTEAGYYVAGESCKALKSAGTVLISGGTVYADSLDDAVHATKDVMVSGGTLTLQTRDDGIHAGRTLNIRGGTIGIPVCYEGLEAAVIDISGGTLSLVSADDGINAVESYQSGQGGRADLNLRVNISGGVITVNSYGDGIDSNGSVTMSGGELYISGPLSSSYGALDYDNSFIISGGVLAAAGSVGMAQTPAQNSTQSSVIVYFLQPRAAGNTYLLTDSGGSVLLSVVPEKDFQCVVLSVPELASGSSYSLYESADGMLMGATLLYDFTVSGIITSVDGT